MSAYRQIKVSRVNRDAPYGDLVPRKAPMDLHLYLFLVPAVEVLGLHRLEQRSGLFEASVEIGKRLERLLTRPVLGRSTRQVCDAVLGHARDSEDLEGKRPHVFVDPGVEILGIGVDALLLGILLGLGKDRIQRVQHPEGVGDVGVVQSNAAHVEMTMNGGWLWLWCVMARGTMLNEG